jgi:hypothetical protein
MVSHRADLHRQALLIHKETIKDHLRFSPFEQNTDLLKHLSCRLFSGQLVTSFHKPESRNLHPTPLPEYKVQKRIDDLVEAHSALIGLLESTILSLANRRQLEVFREELEREIDAF